MEMIELADACLRKTPGGQGCAGGQEEDVVIWSGELCVQGVRRLSPVSDLGKRSGRHHLMEGTLGAFVELEESHLGD